MDSFATAKNHSRVIYQLERGSGHYIADEATKTKNAPGAPPPLTLVVPWFKTLTMIQCNSKPSFKMTKITMTTLVPTRTSLMV